MSDKTMLLSVQCINEHCDDHPRTVAVELNDSLRERISRYAKACKELDASYIECWYYGGTWSNFCRGDTELEDESEMVAEVVKTPASVEMEVLRVAVSGQFCLRAVPKHGSDDQEIYTPQLYIKDIESDTTEVYVKEF